MPLERWKLWRDERRRTPARTGGLGGRCALQSAATGDANPRVDFGVDATEKTIQYDPTGDEHYDVSSALIKSIRGSDPDAALYWLARMLEAGEDVRFICRRLVILASEDIGNADPQALPLAVAAFQACELIGLPECQLTLSQTVSTWRVR